ncbi:MAG: 3-hydroxyanthranilate 3,4-dioxygenase [Phycisphaerales bacterium]|nr:3-hydroxyanthranilate 3,4-dioxygenase [Phycisphaerales bacterium]
MTRMQSKRQVGSTKARKPKKSSTATVRVPARPRKSAARSSLMGVSDNGVRLGTLNLEKWIKANRANLKPPVGNRQLFTDSDDVILFVSGGPNTRNDYHVNPTEELFYQIKGDIAVRIRPLDDSSPRDVIIKQGELFLLPRWVPHRPQRPAGTVGLIVEFPRPDGQLDALRWYCASCDELVNEAQWQLRKIDEDLKIIMEAFWEGPEEQRTCPGCGEVIQRAGAIELKQGKIRKAPRSR